jgi:DNA-binding IscR family transcriptional regulator
MPYEFVNSSIKELTVKNLLIESADTPTTYIPAKDLELISLEEIINASRTNEQSEQFIDMTDNKFRQVDSVLNNIDFSIYQSLENRNLKDFVSDINKQ